jgi:hypothetical protein
VSDSNSFVSLDSITDSTERGVFASVQLWKGYASASESSKMSELASYASLDELCRELAKSALDVMGPGSSKRLIQGDVYDGVKTELGRSTYESIRSSTVLECICYCQSGIIAIVPSINPILESAERTGQAMGGSSILVEKARDLINHDFLVLQFQHQHSSDKLYIRADKIGFPEKKAGVHIAVDKSFPTNAHAVTLFTVAVGHKIELDVVLENLADHTAHYVLSEENCWTYSRAAAKSLLLRCRELPGLTDTEKERSRTEAENIKAHVARKFLRNVVTHCDAKKIWTIIRSALHNSQ